MTYIMIRYFLKRLLLMIPTFFVILLIAYFMTSNLTGTQVDDINAYGTGDALDAFYEKVDAPDNRATKFVRYCYDLIVHGEMGKGPNGSYIKEELAFRLKYTAIVAALGFALSIIIGVPLGIIAAVHHNRWPDHSVSLVSTFLASIPSYCLVLFLVFVFCLWLDVLPLMGITSWKSYVMPAIVLGAGGMALASRMTRSAVLDILSKPYLTVLRAKGLPEWQILYKHVLKNAVSPILSVAGNIAVAVLCSTLIVENFFSIPGLGAYLIGAVIRREQLRLLGTIVVLAIIIMLIGFTADMLGALCNPRFRKQIRKTGGRKGAWE